MNPKLFQLWNGNSVANLQPTRCVPQRYHCDTSCLFSKVVLEVGDFLKSRRMKICNFSTEK